MWEVKREGTFIPVVVVGISPELTAVTLCLLWGDTTFQIKPGIFMVQLGYHIKCQTAKTLSTAFFLKRLENSNIFSGLLLIAHFLSSEEGLFISFYMWKERFVCTWPCVTT